MKTLTGTYKSETGLDYYYIALNLKTGEYVQIKNAGCEAVALTMAYEHFGVCYSLYAESDVKVFFHCNCSDIDLNRIPKKYHRYFYREVVNYF